ncbi:hypothetical protein MPER_01400, partial [Moniliophthora perniciosa FA553]
SARQIFASTRSFSNTSSAPQVLHANRYKSIILRVASCCLNFLSIVPVQSDPRSFSGESHESHNRLVYPEMKAHVRLSGSALSRQIFIRAMVSGFVLELDSTVPDYVFSLFDVYREGKERVTKKKAGELPTLYFAREFLMASRMS